MFNALYIGATGMQAQQASLETIANNVANANTPGFKKGRFGFTDLMVQAAAAAPQDGAGRAATAAAGVAALGLGRSFEAGEIKGTGAPLDLAIRGEGFLEVSLPDGTSAYARGGSLKVGTDGLLAHPSGHPLKPAIAIPANAEGVTILVDGRVQVRMPGQSAPVDAGQIELVRFTSMGDLVPMGDSLYRATEAAGQPMAHRPGEDGAGTLAQGFLEGSNVKMVDEMVSLMLAQRGYEASVKVVQAADDMLGLVNNLRR